jgi:hypothetical protein
MDKSLIVTVFVPTTDVTRADSNGREGVIGTAYPVAADLLLTARHVLEPEPPRCRDDRHPILVRWHYRRGHPRANDGGWIALPEDAIVWKGGGSLDAALLRCSPPEGASGSGIVSALQPDDGMPWTSEGFPRAACYEEVRDPCAFKGSCFSKAPQEDYFELEAHAPPDTETGWQGASGMPIFFYRQLIGIARQVPTNFKAQRLQAVPCWKLLQDSEFRSVLGWDARQTALQRMRRRITKLLTPETAEALADALGIADTLVGLPKPAEYVEGLIASLVEETDIRRVIKALRKAHRGLLDEEGAEIAAPLVEVARFLVPACFNPLVVQSAKALLDAGLIPLPAGTRTVAELVMAAVDERAARFRPRLDRYDQPEGELCLPLHPEAGIQTDAALALADHAARKLDPGRDAIRTMRAPIDHYLIGVFKRREPSGPQRTREERIQLAAQLLNGLRQDTGDTFYMLFWPRDAQARQELIPLVEALKRDYPALAFLELDPSTDQELVDRDLVDPLCHMLPLQQT